MKGTVALVGAANSGKTFTLAKFAQKLLDTDYVSNLTKDKDSFMTAEFNPLAAYAMLEIIDSDCLQCDSSTVFLRDRKIIQSILSNPIFSNFISAASKSDSLENKVLNSLKDKLSRIDKLFPTDTGFQFHSDDRIIAGKKVPIYKIVHGSLTEKETLDEIKRMRDNVLVNKEFLNLYDRLSLPFADAIKALRKDTTHVDKPSLISRVVSENQVFLKLLLFIEEVGKLIHGTKWVSSIDSTMRVDLDQLPNYKGLAAAFFNLLKSSYPELDNAPSMTVVVTNEAGKSFSDLPPDELADMLGSVIGLRVHWTFIKDLVEVSIPWIRQDVILETYDKPAYDLIDLEMTARKNFDNGLVNASKKFRNGLDAFIGSKDEKEVLKKISKLQILDINTIREIIVSQASQPQIKALGVHLSGDLVLPKSSNLITNNGNCYSLFNDIANIKGSVTSYHSLISEAEIRLPLFFVEKRKGIVVISEGDRYSYSSLSLPIANLSNSSMLIFNGTEVIQIPATLASLNSMSIIYGLIVIDSLSMDSEIHGRARLGAKGVNLAIGGSLQQMTVCGLAAGSLFLTIVREGMGSDSSEMAKEIGASVYELVQLTSSGNNENRTFGYSLRRTRHISGKFLFQTMMQSDLSVKTKQLNLLQPSSFYSNYYSGC